ncbi:hypothetical protein LQL77_30590 [Rhodococcus cerastii]|nr:hypothetical protein [Rhodococcus cerastii]
MSLPWRNARYTFIALAGLSLAALGGGIASAAPAPEEFSATQSGVIVPLTVKDHYWVEEHLQCGPSHPYLVLDATGDNASRLFRQATYSTGDHELLRFMETIQPEDASFGPNFTQAFVHVQLQDVNWWHNKRPGHQSVTIYCASTLEAANQK